MKEDCHRQAGREDYQTWQLVNLALYLQPTIKITDIQEAAVARPPTSWHQSRWRENWKKLLWSIPTWCVTPQSGNLPWQQWSLLNHFAQNRDTAMPVERNGDFQTLICVLAARPSWCPTLSNPVLWLSRMATCPGYTLQLKMLFPGWPIIVHDMHTRSRMKMKSCQNTLRTEKCYQQWPTASTTAKMFLYLHQAGNETGSSFC